MQKQELTKRERMCVCVRVWKHIKTFKENEREKKQRKFIPETRLFLSTFLSLFHIGFTPNTKSWTFSRIVLSVLALPKEKLHCLLF